MNSETITCQGAALSERPCDDRHAMVAANPRPPNPRPVSNRDIDDLHAECLAWYEQHARDLPWRSDSAAPWHVMVSEFMLQQTPVVRVLPVYGQWVRRWPHPADLAAVASGE